MFSFKRPGRTFGRWYGRLQDLGEQLGGGFCIVQRERFIAPSFDDVLIGKCGEVLTNAVVDGAKPPDDSIHGKDVLICADGNRIMRPPPTPINPLSSSRAVLQIAESMTRRCAGTRINGRWEQSRRVVRLNHGDFHLIPIGSVSRERRTRRHDC
jgi:hypothetical protein